MIERNNIFDVLKGIGIILVITGHSGVSEPVKTFIFSFHMPLFFFISGYFFKLQSPFAEIAKNVKRLGPAFLFFCFVFLSLGLLKDFICQQNEFINRLLSCFWLSGFRCNMPLYDEQVFIGPMWFIAALFVVRWMASLLFRIKNDVVCGSVVLFVALFGVNLNQLIVLPFAINSACGALGFFYAGFFLRKKNFLGSLKYCSLFPVLCCVWIFCLNNSFMDICRCYYKAFYILDLLGALGAFWLFYGIVNYFFCCNKFYDKLAFVGRYSLVVFCFHSVEENLICWNDLLNQSFFGFTMNAACISVIRLGIAVIGVFLVSKNAFLREKVFCIN